MGYSGGSTIVGFDSLSELKAALSNASMPDFWTILMSVSVPFLSTLN